MSSALGAGNGADMLQQILRQKFTEAIAQQKMAEDIRQANLQNAVQQRQLGQGDQRIALDNQQFGLAKDKFGEDTRQFNEMAPVRIAGVNRANAETSELQRKPQAEIDARAFTTDRDKAQHGYQMGEIGAQGANAYRIAQLNNQTREDMAGKKAATQDANEVSDTIALIDQIKKDPSFAHAFGPVDQYVGGIINGDPAGVNRVRALTDQLTGKMSLAQAGKLKGQGQISDKERAMLASAATALKYGLSEKDALAELDKIGAQFQRMQGGGVAAPSGVNASGAQEYDYVPGKGLVPRGHK
jgi:hypothetical protein